MGTEVVGRAKLGPPHVGDLFVRRHIGGSTLVHMTEGDLREDEPHGLGLSAADAALVMTLVREIKALPAH